MTKPPAPDSAEWGDYVTHWLDVRQRAIEIGLFAERELLLVKALNKDERKFYNAKEWRRLTSNM